MAIIDEKSIMKLTYLQVAHPFLDFAAHRNRRGLADSIGFAIPQVISLFNYYLFLDSTFTLILNPKKQKKGEKI